MWLRAPAQDSDASSGVRFRQRMALPVHVEACEALTRLLASPSLNVLCPGPDYSELLVEAILEADAIGNLVFDAQIAALCRESGVVRLVTEDRDFDRFRGLRTERLTE